MEPTGRTWGKVWDRNLRRPGPSDPPTPAVILAGAARTPVFDGDGAEKTYALVPAHSSSVGVTAALRRLPHLVHVLVSRVGLST